MPPELYQVLLMARDVDRMVHFYRDVVGLKSSYPGTLSDCKNENWVTLVAGQCSLSIHGGGEIRGSGSVILSFRVDDLDYMYWDLKNRGLDIESPRQVSASVRASQLRDPEGNTVSLEEFR